MYQAVDDGMKMSAQITGAFFIIFDIRESRGFPKDFLSSLAYLTQKKQDNVALRAVVGTNIMFRSIYTIVHKIAPHLTENFVLVATMDEALKRIDETDRRHYPE